MGAAPREKLAELTRRPANRYNGYLARLLVLAGTFIAGWLLNYLGPGKPYFALLSIAGIAMVCVGMVLGPVTQRRSLRVAVPLFDLAWIMFAMYLTDGLNSFLLPLLYVVVATAAIRGKNWETGVTIAGAVTGIFLVASTHITGLNLALAVAQSTLLAAAAFGVRLASSANGYHPETQKTERLYRVLLESTSDAVFTLDPEDWTIREANPAAALLLLSSPDEPLVGRSLTDIVRFNDQSFPQTCRRTLDRAEQVRDAVTYARTAEGREVILRFNLQATGNDQPALQAIVDVAEDDSLSSEAPRHRDNFSVNYIPALTHELNNHLAAIRLSAELAAATGKLPDFEEMQTQVDRCQDVLQTVVLQILRSSVPQTPTARVPQAEFATVVERALLLARPQILTCGVQLDLSLPEALPPVSGYAHEFQEALVRVLLRSAKAMARQDTPRLLSLHATQRHGFLEVLITDSSDGLNSRELMIANGRFAAVSRAEDRTWDIVRDAFCRFGGTVNASNGLNGGMRLKIEVPVVVQEVSATA